VSAQHLAAALEVGQRVVAEAAAVKEKADHGQGEVSDLRKLLPDTCPEQAIFWCY
jgi:hypothetical protein